MSEPDRVYAWPENGGSDGEDARSCKDDFGESCSDVLCIGVGDCASSGVRYACGCICTVDVVEARRGMYPFSLVNERGKNIYEAYRCHV